MNSYEIYSFFQWRGNTWFCVTDNSMLLFPLDLLHIYSLIIYLYNDIKFIYFIAIEFYFYFDRYQCFFTQIRLFIFCKYFFIVDFFLYKILMIAIRNSAEYQCSWEMIFLHYLWGHICEPYIEIRGTAMARFQISKLF